MMPTTRSNLRRVTAALATAGLLLAPSAASAAEAAPASGTDLQITRVAKASGGKTLAVTVRYRCAPGMLNEVVGTYDTRSFDWVGEDELYGQEESRVFDVPCTGRYETAKINLVVSGRLPKRVHVFAGIGVSDPSDWSFEVANDTRRARV